MNLWYSFALVLLLQITAACAAALGVMYFCKTKAAWRHAVGCMALVFVLLSPVLTTFLPAMHWQLGHDEPTLANDARSADDTASIESAGRAIRITSSRGGIRAESPALGGPVQPEVAELPSVGTQKATIIAAGDGGMHWADWFKAHRATWIARTFGLAIAVWITGIVVLLARSILAWRQLRILARSARPITGDVAAMEDARRTLGIAKLPPVAVSDAAPMPMVLGRLWPRVILPSSLLETCAANQLRDVLVHECAHILRRDPLVHALQQVANVVFWPHPLVHRLNYEISKAREELCDNFVLRAASPTDYAQALLEIAERCAAPLAIAPLGLFSQRWTLEERISGILNSRRETTTRASGKVSIAVVVVLAALCALIGGVGVYGQDNKTTPAVPDSTGVKSNPPSSLMKRMDRVVTLQGTCQDDAGKPVAGARVRLFPYAGYNQPCEALAEVKSDAEGKFTFKDVKCAAPGEDKNPRPDFNVFATAPHYVSASALVNSLDPNRPLSLKFQSNPGTLSGVVKDTSGKPVPGVKVFASVSVFIPEYMSAVTGQDGRYEITDLKRWTTANTTTFDPKTGTGWMVSSCYFRLAHPDFALTLGKYSAVPQTVDVTLKPPAIAKGQVIDKVTGKPLPNVQVMAQGIAHGDTVTTRTDESGHYKLMLNEDYYNIWADADERIAIAVKALASEPGQTTEHADISMVPGGFVAGNIIDGTTGQPLTVTADHPLQVAHYGPAHPRTGAACSSTVVNLDGSYRIRVAPGRNYVYVMDGSASDIVEVEDGKVVRLDLRTGKHEADSVNDNDPDILLASRLRKALSDKEDDENSLASTLAGAKPKKAPVLRKRAATPTGQLLDKLEGQNAGSAEFSESWLATLKAIVDLGPDAVPELIDELESTNSHMMMSCMGFTLRAIGDKRAMPALIRAIPKTLSPPESDMGLKAEDAELLKFAQQNDLNKRAQGKEYYFGRPMSEILGALQKLTGKEFGEEELYNIFLEGTASQRRMQQKLFYRTAQQWADWWEQNSADLVTDAAYQKVKLTKPADAQIAAKDPNRVEHYKTGIQFSGDVLESVLAPKAREVFYDLDTCRIASLPKKWRDAKDIELHMDEIVAWAGEEGFDMMGTEYTAANGERHYAIRAIGMQTWELPPSRRKSLPNDITVDALKAEGTPIEGLLLHHEKATGGIDPAGTAPVFYITKEGTPGVLFVGVEVKDNGLRPGGMVSGDEELKPIAFQKGRRFGLTHLEEAK